MVLTLSRLGQPALGGEADTPARGRLAAQVAFPGRLGLSVEEFADAVGIGRTSAYLAVQRGEIPTRRIGRRVIVPLAALDAWLSEHENPGVI